MPRALCRRRASAIPQALTRALRRPRLPGDTLLTPLAAHTVGTCTKPNRSSGFCPNAIGGRRSVCRPLWLPMPYPTTDRVSWARLGAFLGLWSSRVPVQLQDAVGQDAAGRGQALSVEQRQQVLEAFRDLLWRHPRFNQRIEILNFEVAQNIRFIFNL